MNDPPLSWLVVAAYAFVAVAAFLAAGESRNDRERRLWLLVAVTLSLLAANKQVDLQTWFVDQLRTLAKLQGWYEGRRTAQMIFLLMLGVGGLVVSVQLIAWLRGLGWPVVFAVGGLIVLLSFIVVKTASISHLDQWFGSVPGFVDHSWAFELAGIAIIAAAAAARRKPVRGRRKTRGRGGRKARA